MTVVKLKLPRGPARWFLLGFTVLFLLSVTFTFAQWSQSGARGLRSGRQMLYGGGASGEGRGMRWLAGGGKHQAGVLWDAAIGGDWEWEYRRALQYEGTGSRVRAFLDKALNGQPIVVSVIGGSVSKGRGLALPTGSTRPYSPSEGSGGDKTLATLYSPENMHVRIFNYLNQTFPHAENRFVNGAQGGVGSAYFGWCFAEHIPEDSDLVLVELGINDLHELDTLESYEHLIRSLLQLDSAPAIINIETFTALFPSLVSASALHHDVLAYYDVPSLSIRDLLLPGILASPETELPRWFRTDSELSLSDPKVREWGGTLVDMLHISAEGHALAASLAIGYIDEQLSQAFLTDRRSRVTPIHSPSPASLSVPIAYLSRPIDLTHPLERRAQHCRSMNSPRLHSPVSGTDDARGTPAESNLHSGLVLAGQSHGWSHWAWQEKSYLVATQPGSRAVFQFITSTPTSPYSSLSRRTSDSSLSRETDLGSRDTDTSNRFGRGTTGAAKSTHSVNVGKVGKVGGTVNIAYQRSASYGLGSVWCWVDEDREGGTRMNGWWAIKEQNMGVVSQVASGLAPGPHTLQCELLEETLDPKDRHEFRLFAIMHD